MAVPGTYVQKTTSDTGTPTPIQTTTATDDSAVVEASNSLGAASVAYDSNTGTVRLAPLLNFAFSSYLAGNAYWIETPINGAEASGTLARNNRYETLTKATPTVTSTALTVGFPNKITNNVTANSDGTLKAGNANTAAPSQLQYKVYGYGTPYSKGGGFINDASMATPHHRNNMFIPNGNTLNFGWKEQSLKELAQKVGTGNTGSIPLAVIRPNLEFFRVGDNPINVAQVDRYAGKTENLSTEYGLTSSFTLPENCSFAISLVPYDTAGEFSGANNSPAGLPYFRVYWANYAFQYSTNPSKAFFIPDTTGSADDWIFEPILGLKLAKDNANPVVTFIFEVVANGILISNFADMGDKDIRDKRPGWYWQDIKVAQTGLPLLVPPTKLLIGARGIDVGFSYIPVVYPPKGEMSVANLPTGYSVNGLRVSKKIDSSAQMGGTVTAKTIGVDVGTGSFGFKVTIKRGSAVDKTPALFAVEVVADPTTTTLSASLPSTNNRVKKVEVRLSMNDVGGSITLDNRDGVFSQVGGIFPIQISAGWVSGQFGAIFDGFVDTTAGIKTPNSSEIQFSLKGRDLILKDAIAINLPIYDGMSDDQAVIDLLGRAAFGTNYSVDGGYQLPVPNTVTQPRFKFPMGKPILECIREIATIAGKWAFINNLGAFIYVTPSQSYGASLGTYIEKPVQNSYNEWLSLGASKDTVDSRNAIMVVGMSGILEAPVPLIAIRKAEGGSLGVPSGNIIPWYRWYVYQDPKLNTQAAVEGVAEKLYQNSNRLRWNVSGQVWGNHNIVPFARFGINLLTDDVGIPASGTFRVVSVTHSLNSGDHLEYFSTIEGEYIDPRYTYTTWW